MFLKWRLVAQTRVEILVHPLPEQQTKTPAPQKVENVTGFESNILLDL